MTINPNTEVKSSKSDPRIVPLLGKSTIEIAQQEISEKAIKSKIVDTYKSLIVRIYCRIRFQIINSRFLEEIEQHMPAEGRLLDIGCGFGLFDCYFAMNQRKRQIFGVDINEERIEEARSVAAKLGLDNLNFSVADASTYAFGQSFDAVVMLDILHHIDRESANRLVQASYDNLAPGGVFIVKDVNVFPFHKILFTYALDKLMDFQRSVHYRDANAWKQLFLEVGFRHIYIYYLNDYLPYPHILMVCQK